MTAMQRILRFFRFPLACYLIVLLTLMILEEKMIFVPSRYPAGEWMPVGFEFEDAHFAAKDGTELHGWFVEAEQPRAVILFCHGNAGNITHRTDVARQLRKLRASVLLFDYRGYGKSAGSPNEAGVLADARAARAWLAERAAVEPEDVVLMGRSLGGGVAVDLATDGARGLVLESTFSSIPDVAAFHYPWAPVRWLLKTNFNSASKIASYEGPILQSHGDRDDIIPFEFGQRLHDAAVKSREKEFYTIAGGGHNHTQPTAFYERLSAFLDRLDE